MCYINYFRLVYFNKLNGFFSALEWDSDLHPNCNSIQIISSNLNFYKVRSVASLFLTKQTAIQYLSKPTKSLGFHTMQDRFTFHDYTVHDKGFLTKSLYNTHKSKKKRF